MSRRLGIGVVGVNPRIRRSILNGIKFSNRGFVAGVVSREPARATEATREYGGNPYTTIGDLIDDPAVDAVFICTPFALHHSMSLEVLRRGKPVICEKPLARTLAEAEEMAQTAAALGLPNVVNFTYHSLPGHRFIAQLLHSGQIGRLRHIALTYWQARQRLPNAIPSDALMEVGSHEIDLALWWIDAGGGGDIVEMTGDQSWQDNGAASIFTVIGRTTLGGAVSIQANRVAAGWRNGMDCRLIGDDGSIVLTFDTDQTEVRVAKFGEGSAEGTLKVVPVPADLSVSYADFPAFHVDRLIAGLEGEIDFPDFHYGLRCQRVLDAIRRSTDERRWLRLD